MKPLLPNTYVINNKYLQSILSPSTDIIDYNFTPDQIHKLNLLQILRPDIYFNKKLILLIIYLKSDKSTENFKIKNREGKLR